MQTIKAVHKIGCREFLEHAPDTKHIFENNLPFKRAYHIHCEGKGKGRCVSLPKYNEEGDPITEEYIQEIMDAVKAIIDEHNAAIVNEE